jgi:hypothetical protein
MCSAVGHYGAAAQSGALLVPRCSTRIELGTPSEFNSKSTAKAHHFQKHCKHAFHDIATLFVFECKKNFFFVPCQIFHKILLLFLVLAPGGSKSSTFLTKISTKVQLFAF